MGNTSSGSSKSQVLNYANTTASSAFLEVVSKCTNTISVDQDIVISSTPGTIKLEDSTPCVRCIEALRDDLDLQNQLQREAKADTVLKPIDTYFGEAERALKGCSTICKSLVIRDISQVGFVNLNSSCSLDTDTATKWRQKVSGEFFSALYSRSDAAAALLAAVKSSQQDETVVDVVNKAVNRLDASLVSRIVNVVNVQQSVTINAGAASQFKGVHQSVLADAVATTMARSKVFDDVLSDTQWSVMESTWTENTTLGPLGDAVNKIIGSLGDLISNAVGILLICVICLAVAASIGLILFITLQSSPRGGT